jgi:hypothetical protein
MRMVLCKRCYEPWDFTEVGAADILDYFSDDDYVQLRLDKKQVSVLDMGSPQWNMMISYVISQITFGHGCFSCGFDPLHQKTYAGALYPGAYIINMGEIETITGDAPDPSVGLYGGWVEVTFDRDNSPLPIEDAMTFQWDQEVLIRSPIG